ncbi:MAG: 50S ribosomal protein L31 [Patescibacteria group bacterium]|nr:50S ribosomal protein L31 [Patescibacteria group bacterium]MCL5257788.1 50S ribosomal protein L31 [Patescibacteria group bacterium]
MKKKIHPVYQFATVKCVCGASYQIPSTKKIIEVEVCKNCSPVFTGKEERRVILGQVEKFKKRQAKQTK